MLTKSFLLLAIHTALASASIVANQPRGAGSYLEPRHMDKDAVSYNQWKPNEEHKMKMGPSQWHHHSAGPSQMHHDDTGKDHPAHPTKTGDHHSKEELSMTRGYPTGELSKTRGWHHTEELSQTRGWHNTELSKTRGYPTGTLSMTRGYDNDDGKHHWGPSQGHHGHHKPTDHWGPSQMHHWKSKPTNGADHDNGKDKWHKNKDGMDQPDGHAKDNDKSHWSADKQSKGHHASSDGKDNWYKGDDGKWHKKQDGKSKNEWKKGDDGKWHPVDKTDGHKGAKSNGHKDQDDNSDHGSKDTHGNKDDNTKHWGPSASARARLTNGKKEGQGLYALYGQAAADVCGLDGQITGAEITACPLENSSGWDCLNLASTLESCGGCQSLGEGQDCTQIKGAETVGCIRGKCVIGTCEDGFWLDSDKGQCVGN